jgi:DNA-binding NtrC family response regulator
METQGLNLFIVDDNITLLTALELYLKNRFGAGLAISTFVDGETCLEKVDKETHIVILDYFLEGKNGLEVLKSIKAINPKTEVIMLTGNENIALAIESFQAGAKGYVIKGQGSWWKLTQMINRIITEPIRAMVREYGVPKFMIIFFATFITMGLVVYYFLHK